MTIAHCRKRIEKQETRDSACLLTQIKSQQLTTPDQRLPSEPSEPLLTYTTSTQGTGSQGTVSGSSSLQAHMDVPAPFLTAG